MDEQSHLRCPNCGTEGLPAPEGGVEESICKVCGYHFQVEAANYLTEEELTSQIAGLVARARSSGLSHERITRILRDELAFAAELTSPGRRMHVQVIDLGPAETTLFGGAIDPRPSLPGRPLLGVRR
jgi:hypothetical protein